MLCQVTLDNVWSVSVQCLEITQVLIEAKATKCIGVELVDKFHEAGEQFIKDFEALSIDYAGLQSKVLWNCFSLKWPGLCN